MRDRRGSDVFVDGGAALTFLRATLGLSVASNAEFFRAFVRANVPGQNVAELDPSEQIPLDLMFPLDTQLAFQVWNLTYGNNLFYSEWTYIIFSYLEYVPRTSLLCYPNSKRIRDKESHYNSLIRLLMSGLFIETPVFMETDWESKAIQRYRQNVWLRQAPGTPQFRARFRLSFDSNFSELTVPDQTKVCRSSNVCLPVTD
jgi:hypothetical protein